MKRHRYDDLFVQTARRPFDNAIRSKMLEKRGAREGKQWDCRSGVGKRAPFPDTRYSTEVLLYILSKKLNVISMVLERTKASRASSPL